MKLLKDINMVGACTFMQRVFPHGARWHPRVAPFGQMKCVNCRCNVSISLNSEYILIKFYLFIKSELIIKQNGNLTSFIYGWGFFL